MIQYLLYVINVTIVSIDYRAIKRSVDRSGLCFIGTPLATKFDGGDILSRISDVLIAAVRLSLGTRDRLSVATL